jgi:hypothetical protein
MLKSFSAQTNALGALNYKGTWDATANSPALASSVGTKGDYYVVSVAGSTALNGISNWGIGDWAVFNGSVWQRVEGGADVNAVNLTVSGNTTLSGPLSVTPTWNAGGTTFTGIGLNVTNTASAAGSLLLDLQVGGGSQFYVTKQGVIRLNASNTFVSELGIQAGSSGYGPIAFHGSVSGAANFAIRDGIGVTTRAANVLAWVSDDNPGSGTVDLSLARDAADTLAQRRSTNAQAFRLYNTYTDASNYERLNISWASNICSITPADAGTGTLRPLLVRFPTTTVASLPAAATAGAGARMFVSDASVPVFGAAVVGGGAVTVPVYSDGSAWNVG